MNPATGRNLACYETMVSSEIAACLDAADTTQRHWNELEFRRRSTALTDVATELRRRSNALALLITREMGKPIGESLAEVEKCAGVVEYYAKHGPSFLADAAAATEADESWVSYEPVGVVLGIMPWNYPLWQVFRFAAPALMAGNTVLLKHAPNTTGCALEIQDVFSAAGLRPGTFTSLVVAEFEVPTATRQLIADPRVGAVTLTGSEQAGAAVGALAGHQIKKCVLELGGSDPFVVLADADIPEAAACAAKGRFLNAGQSCISPKRFIVEEPVADQFTELLTENVARLRVGDPEDPDTDVGPVARADLRDAIDRQVRSSRAAGAVAVIGGEPITSKGGNFYQPTVLTNVRPGMPAYDEEIFGPVAAVIRVCDADHAIAVANDTRFGLGSSVWGSNVAHAASVGRRITAGACFINELVTSDPRLPFGGTKRSGFGRELSLAGIHEFVHTRTWWVMKKPRWAGSQVATEQQT